MFVEGIPWTLIRHDEPTADAQMRYDLELVKRAQPALRLFRWATPAVSFGWKQQRPAWTLSERLASYGIETVERPTGGGIAIHGSDVSCAIVVPHQRGLHLAAVMAALCDVWTDAARAWGVAATALHHVHRQTPIVYCLTDRSPYAVMVGARKVGGFAIRRFPEAFLIQGSFLVEPVPQAIQDAMPEAVRQAYASASLALTASQSQRATATDVDAAVFHAWHQRWPSGSLVGEHVYAV